MKNEIKVRFESISDVKKKLTINIILFITSFFLFPLSNFILSYINVPSFVFLLPTPIIIILIVYFLLKLSNYTTTKEDDLLYRLYLVHDDLVKFTSNMNKPNFKNSALKNLNKISSSLELEYENRSKTEWDSIKYFDGDKEELVKSIRERVIPTINTGNKSDIEKINKYLEDAMDVLLVPKHNSLNRISKSFEKIKKGKVESRANLQGSVSYIMSTKFGFLIVMLLVSIIICGVLIYGGGWIYSKITNITLNDLIDKPFMYWFMGSITLYAGIMVFWKK